MIALGTSFGELEGLEDEWLRWCKWVTKGADDRTMRDGDDFDRELQEKQVPRPLRAASARENENIIGYTMGGEEEALFPWCWW